MQFRLLVIEQRLEVYILIRMLDEMMYYVYVLIHRLHLHGEPSRQLPVIRMFI